MDIKRKIKSAWQRMTGKKAKKPDSELGADQVVKKEIFPKTPTKPQAKKTTAKAKATATTKSTVSAKKTTASKTGCTKKPPSKRTRPTNDNYRMIDPSGDTCDTGKS